MSKEVAVKEEAALPALTPTPALQDIGADDISLPRLYKGETQSNAFKDDLVPKGCIFVASGGDDPNPEVIWKQGDEPGVLVHILDVFKRWSANLDADGNVVKSGGEFTHWAFDDPERHPDADLDYHYVVVAPEIDPDIPLKVTLSKTSVPTARRINFLLKRNEGQGLPLHAAAFRLTCKERKSEKGGTKYAWFVWQAAEVDDASATIEAAAKAAQLVAGSNVRNDIETTSTTTDAPDI